MTKRSLKDEARLVRHVLHRKGVTQMHLSDRLGVSQSQISRILSGKIQRRSLLFNRICEYAYSLGEGDESLLVDFPSRLIEALASAYDGTDASADALETILRSISMLALTRPDIGDPH